MKYISHRGNIIGSQPKIENTRKYIEKTLVNYDVEIDIWYINNKFYLGHDKPSEKVNLKFLSNPKLWCHAKNIDALYESLKYKLHVFYHNIDDVVLTSNRIIWTFPGKPLTKISVCNTHKKIIKKEYINCYGICSDYIKYFKEKING